MWHFDFEEPTAVLLQMSDGGINSLWGWAECTDSVLFVGLEKASPVLRVCQFQAPAAWVSERVNFEPNHDFDAEWEKNFSKEADFKPGQISRKPVT